MSRETEYFERADVRRIWSLATTLKEAPSTETMLDLLQQNSRTKLGAWSIERNDKGEYLVIYCEKIDATSSPEAVKSSIEYVAQLTSLAKKSLPAGTSSSQSASQTLEAWLAP